MIMILLFWDLFKPQVSRKINVCSTLLSATLYGTWSFGYDSCQIYPRALWSEIDYRIQKSKIKNVGNSSKA
jgi:hypothetical protein